MASSLAGIHLFGGIFSTIMHMMHPLQFASLCPATQRPGYHAEQLLSASGSILLPDSFPQGLFTPASTAACDTPLCTLVVTILAAHIGQ